MTAEGGHACSRLRARYTRGWAGGHAGRQAGARKWVSARGLGCRGWVQGACSAGWQAGSGSGGRNRGHQKLARSYNAKSKPPPGRSSHIKCRLHWILRQKVFLLIDSPYSPRQTVDCFKAEFEYQREGTRRWQGHATQKADRPLAEF